MYKILIADDEAVEREALLYIVKAAFGHDCETEEAENGKNAILVAEEFYPDIVMMDIKMPVLSGIDAAKKILKKNPDCKIIMLTGFTYFNYARDSVRIGAFDLLVKPVDDETVVGTLKRAMDEVEKIRSRQVLLQKDREKNRMSEWYRESRILSDILFCGMEGDLMEQAMREIQIGKGYFTAVILFPDTEYGRFNSAERIEETCRQVLPKLELEGIRILLCEHYGRVYMLMISDKSRKRTEYMRFLEKLLREVTARQNCTAGMGVSEECDDYTALSDLFKQAQKAYRKTNAIQFYMGKVFPEAELENQRALEQEFCEYFEKRRFMELLSRMHTVIGQFFVENNEPRSRIYELLIILNRKASNYIPVEPTYQLHSKLGEMKDRQCVERFAIRYVQGLIDHLILQDTEGNDEWVRKMDQFIQTNYKESITLEDGAKAAGFSTYYFSRLFKQYFQMTFIEYLTQVRLTKAKYLLERPGSIVKEVCYQVGYREPNYFARVFKKATGVSPSEYQKKCRKAK